MTETVTESKTTQELLRPLLRLWLLFACDHLRDRNIFQRRKLPQQMVKLVDESDCISAQRGTFAVTHFHSGTAKHIHLSSIWSFEQTSKMQQRGFPGPRWRHECDSLAGMQRKVHPTQDFKTGIPAAVCTHDPGKSKLRVSHGAAFPRGPYALPATTGKLSREKQG